MLARSVELGYRVVDEYLARGQEAAQRARNGTHGAPDVARDVQSVAEQLVRSASDFAGAWVEFFAFAGRDVTRQTVAPVPPMSDVSTAGPMGDSTGSAAAASVRVRLRVDTGRRVEATLDMGSVVAGQVLVAHRLRRADGGDRIDEVSVEHDVENGITIRVAVPDRQPPGRYVGCVVDDATNVRVGEITIGID